MHTLLEQTLQRTTMKKQNDWPNLTDKMFFLTCIVIAAYCWFFITHGAKGPDLTASIVVFYLSLLAYATQIQKVTQ